MKAVLFLIAQTRYEGANNVKKELAMKEDRFLMVIVSGIVLLVAVALAVVLLRTPESQAYVGDDTPAGLGGAATGRSRCGLGEFRRNGLGRHDCSFL